MGTMRERPNGERQVLSLMMSSYTLTHGSTNDDNKSREPHNQERHRVSEDPARNVSDSVQNPVTIRAGNSGCVQIRELCNSTRIISIQQNTTVTKTQRRRETHSIKM